MGYSEFVYKIEKQLNTKLYNTEWENSTRYL